MISHGSLGLLTPAALGWVESYTTTGCDGDRSPTYVGYGEDGYEFGRLTRVSRSHKNVAFSELYLDTIAEVLPDKVDRRQHSTVDRGDDLGGLHAPLAFAHVRPRS